MSDRRLGHLAYGLLLLAVSGLAPAWADGVELRLSAETGVLSRGEPILTRLLVKDAAGGGSYLTLDSLGHMYVNVHVTDPQGNATYVTSEDARTCVDDCPMDFNSHTFASEGQVTVALVIDRWYAFRRPGRYEVYVELHREALVDPFVAFAEKVEEMNGVPTLYTSAEDDAWLAEPAVRSNSVAVRVGRRDERRLRKVAAQWLESATRGDEGSASALTHMLDPAAAPALEGLFLHDRQHAGTFFHQLSNRRLPWTPEAVGLLLRLAETNTGQADDRAARELRQLASDPSVDRRIRDRIARSNWNAARATRDARATVHARHEPTVAATGPGAAAAEHGCDGLDIGPVNGSNLAEMVRCVEAWGVDDRRSMAILQRASGRGREEATLVLLQRGVAPTEPARFLREAAGADLPRVVDFMLGQNAAVAPAQRLPLQPALEVAAGSGAYRSARLLLDHGADAHSWKSLEVAASRRHLHIFHLLVERGARPQDLSSEQAATLLKSAVLSTDWMFVKQLLDEHRLDPNAIAYEVPHSGHHVLAWAGIHEDAQAGRGIWDVLIQYGADPRRMACGLLEQKVECAPHMHEWFWREVENHRDDCGSAAAADASPTPSLRASSADCATFDIGPIIGTNRAEMAACVDAWGVGDERSKALLEHALGYMREDAVLDLLGTGVEPEDPARFLQLAATYDLPRVVGFMLDRNAMAGERHRLQPALNAAAGSGAYRATRLLLDRGAHPQSAQGLREAVVRANLHTFNLLIERGATLDTLRRDDAADIFTP